MSIVSKPAMESESSTKVVRECSVHPAPVSRLSATRLCQESIASKVVTSKFVGMSSSAIEAANLAVAATRIEVID